MGPPGALHPSQQEHSGGRGLSCAGIKQVVAGRVGRWRVSGQWPRARPWSGVWEGRKEAPRTQLFSPWVWEAEMGDQSEELCARPRK